MKYARIQISKQRWDMREKSVPIVIQSRYISQQDKMVYAPKSRIIVEQEVSKPLSTPDMIILVPVWVFAKAGLNAFDAYGFVEGIEKK